MSKYHQRRGFSFSSCFATLFGVFLFPICIFGLYITESAALRDYLTQEFAKNNYIETSAENIKESQEGKLVLVHGNAATTDILVDNTFNQKINNSLSLKRKVEMYQWGEIEHKHSHTTGSGKHKRTRYTYSYTYNKSWSEYVINSDNFHNKSDYINPNKMYHHSSTFYPKNVKVGKFKVDSAKLKDLGSAESINIDESTIILPDSAILMNNKIYYNIYQEAKYRKAKQQKEAQEIKNDNASNTVDSTVNMLLEDSFSNDNDNTIEKEKPNYNENNPKIGDVRISFEKHPVCEVTVLAKQSGDELVPYKTEYAEIYEFSYGNVGFDEIYKQKALGMAIFLWLARIIAFLTLGFAFLMISFSIEKIGCAIGLSLPLAITTGIIGFIWLPHRLGLGIISLILMVIGLIITISSIIKIKSENDNYSRNKYYQ